MTSLINKVAIVTGSASGIGEAIARLLYKHGVNVVINSVSSREKGIDIAKELSGSIYCQADITKEEDCQKLIDTAIKNYGRLDFLINNAGGSARLPITRVTELTNEMFNESFEINLLGTWSLTRLAIPHLKNTGEGVIINITSCAAIDPDAVKTAIPYAVSKAAVNYLTKILAKELGPEIRVNAIAPGLIVTPRNETYYDAIIKFETHTPLKRVGRPVDIAELVIGIIKSDYIDGEIILVDGGFSTS